MALTMLVDCLRRSTGLSASLRGEGSRTHSVADAGKNAWLAGEPVASKKRPLETVEISESPHDETEIYLVRMSLPSLVACSV